MAKITGIKPQLRQTSRYSIFVDGKYEFSLSEAALLEAKLVSGQELSNSELKAYKQLSADDKLYARTLKYVALRPRSVWEVRSYLERKQAEPKLTEHILNKLKDIGLVDDALLAKAIVSDRQLLKPSSKVKITFELRKKHLPESLIEKALNSETYDDQTALKRIIETKRRQTKYQDDLKLMQYLSRQGFSYHDIKTAMKDPID